MKDRIASKSEFNMRQRLCRHLTEESIAESRTRFWRRTGVSNPQRSLTRKPGGTTNCRRHHHDGEHAKEILFQTPCGKHPAAIREFFRPLRLRITRFMSTFGWGQAQQA